MPVFPMVILKHYTEQPKDKNCQHHSPSFTLQLENSQVVVREHAAHPVTAGWGQQAPSELSQASHTNPSIRRVWLGVRFVFCLHLCAMNNKHFPRSWEKPLICFCRHSFGFSTPLFPRSRRYRPTKPVTMIFLYQNQP